MHDNSISTGDSYLKSLLIGSGTLSNPASGSLLASSVFTTTSYRTMLYIWWDEYDPSPNIQYGSMLKEGYVSTNKNYDEYASLHTIEANWGLPYLTSAVSGAPYMSDVFGGSAPGALSATSDSLSTLTFLYIGLIAGGAVSVTIYLAKYHSHNRKLAAVLQMNNLQTHQGIHRSVGKKKKLRKDHEST